MSVHVEHPRRLTILPTTQRGWWAVGLAAVFLPLVFAAGIVPLAAAIGLLCGLGGGLAAVIAIVRDGERALTVLLAVVPLVIALAFVLAQVISGTP
jgi:hypothetical protein